LLIKDLILQSIKEQDYMHIQSNELERTKNRTLLVIIFLIIGFISCFIILTILTAYYRDLIKKYYSGPLMVGTFPGSIVPFHQEITTIEIFWMLNLLLSFIFMNATIWYCISYGLIKKAAKSHKSEEKINDEVIICFRCRTHIYKKLSTKNSSGLTPIKIFNIKGYFCQRCYRHYFMLSLGTIILVPIIYFLYLPFAVFILYLMNLSYIPTIHYLQESSYLVLIISLIAVFIYLIYGSNKTSKIYDL
jgi:hypothetical protein